MGKSNPSGRGYANAHNSMITNQFTAGGNKKAGIPSSVGLGWFASIAMFGRGGTQLGQVGRSGGRVAGTIPHFSVYPVPNINQIGGVGMMPRWGMHNPSADGVNLAALNAGRARVRAGPPGWGLFN